MAPSFYPAQVDIIRSIKRPLAQIKITVHAETWACLALAWLSIGVSAWSFSRHFEGGVTQEFCQYAEIGRNILEGRGLRTRAVFPFTLAYLDQRGIPFDAATPAPVLDRFPLQAYLTATAEALLGQTDAAPAALSAFLLSLCVMATCAIGWRLFGPAQGILAGLFLALNPSFQRGFVLWGLPDFGFCLLTLAAAFLACLDSSKRDAYWIGAGAVAGLAWLARSNFVIWLPLFAWALRSPASGRAKRWTAFFAGLVLAASPGWIYSLRWYGGIAPPTFAWNLAHHVVQDEYPLLSYRTFSTWDIVAHHLPALWRKFWLYLYLHLRDFPSLWQMHLLFPLMLCGIYSVEKTGTPPPESSRSPAFQTGTDAGDPALARRFVRLAMAMLAVQAAIFSALRYERLGAYVAGRYLIWWAPIAFILSAHGIIALGRRLRQAQDDPPMERPGWMRKLSPTLGSRIIPAFLTTAAIGWFIPYLVAPQGPPAHPSRLRVSQWPEIQAAAQAADSHDLIVTNLPAQTAWYARRPAVGLPADPADLMAIEQRHPVSAVLISRLPIGEISGSPAWQRLLADPAKFNAFCKQAGLTKAQDFGTAILLKRLPQRNTGKSHK